ncbi:MAG: hypothetical protein JXB85_13685 [Anaerolineales bacterium]|nr:hypothetical protein [Anaerolineales bacterium]
MKPFQFLNSTAGFTFMIVLLAMPIFLISAFLPEGALISTFYSRDDAFYYFQVARNVAEGHGFTFDGIAVTNGFHPLWALICIPIFAFARHDLILPFRILTVVLGLLNAGTALFLHRAVSQAVSTTAGKIAALVWIFSMPVQMVIGRDGVEAGLNAFLLSAFISMVIRLEQEPGWTTRQKILLGSMAALVFFARLDNIFLVASVTLWLILRPWQLRYVVIVDILACAISVALSFYLRLGTWGQNFYNFELHRAAFYLFLAAACLRPILNYCLGLDQAILEFNGSRKAFFLRLLLTTLTGSALLGGLMIVLQATAILPAFPRSIILFEFVTCFLLLALGRILLQRRITPPRVESHLARPEWIQVLKNALFLLGPLVLGLIGYLAINLAYAGTLAPVSGQIKQWWGQLEFTVYGLPVTALPSALDFGVSIWPPLSQLIYFPIRSYFDALGAPSGLAAILVITACLAILLLAPRTDVRATSRGLGTGMLVPLATGCILQFLYYDLNYYVAHQEWYWVAQMLVAVILLAGVLDGIINIPPTTGGKLAAQMFLWIACSTLGFHFFWHLYGNIATSLEAHNPYRQEAAFLEEHTEPGSMIGMTGGGGVGYFLQDRVIMNLDGLINSYEYFRYLRDGRASGYYARVGLDYVYGSPYMILESIPYASTFGDHVHEIASARTGTLYEYVP